MAAPRVIDIRSRHSQDSLADQVLNGLSNDPKTLPAQLFYTNKGLEYWNHHSRQPDFYPRQEEIRILQEKGHDMARSIAPNSVILDLGSANLEKVTYLLEALEAQQKPAAYFALDLSASQLASTLSSIPAHRFRHVRLTGLHGTFEDGLRWISHTPEICDLPHCVLLLGLTIGNFSRANAAAFLSDIAQRALQGQSSAQSSIFMSLDSCKVPTRILRAYTSDGVVPFALQALTHAKTLFQAKCQDRVNGAHSYCNLDPDDWYYLSQWNFGLGRHEASLIPRSKDVQLGPLLNDMVVRKDEKVRFGCSYKYDASERHHLFAGAGLKLEATWTTDECHVAIYDLKLS
ncbi:uncharacterized protein MAM_04508 [Metarhizium album ARSEF 1941]|uniref:4-dimethylallyltryptophan N-methyltransferase n=1 Tax=Metarhizium album (strain ARSEF 1941) TaxID=1081103 RepID=A0A0B2WTW1_METAS|nr:uncharacterized protein MAM_04508 [Metarhizium album ARSEF 1941]KHN97493.1 hypothetical protein MAM_04508 [Metarhizium album ARSEF 1941]